MNTQKDVTSARRFFMSLFERSDFSDNLTHTSTSVCIIEGDMVCLPPMKDAFQLYLRRDLHEVAVWKRAQLSQPKYPVVPIFGTELIGGKLVATMLLKDAKPAAFKRKTCCRCQKSVLAWGYSCARGGVTCPHWILCWSQQMFKCSRIELALEDSEMHYTL